MPTGACGINCDVCRLRLFGICSSCGHGRSVEAKQKLSAQKMNLGSACVILECATLNNVMYCLKDCDQFPCENFQIGPYPYSKGFLNMQERRRRERPQARDPNGRIIHVPESYWGDLKERDIQKVCNITISEYITPHQFVFRFLNEKILVDLKENCIKREKHRQWEKTEDSLLELVALVYFNHVNDMYQIGNDIVSPKDLKEAHYFKGNHDLNIFPVLERFEDDGNGFKSISEHLDGKPVDMAHLAYRFLPFPRVPIYYLLWQRDSEFAPRMSIIFDRSIEETFPASIIWCLCNLVSLLLLKGVDYNDKAI